MADAYDDLAGIYEWLTPEVLLTPEGSAAAFADVVDGLAPGARVLDCACGTGQVAVGLALRGFDVVATDASGAMVRRTSALAAERGVSLEALRCAWSELPDRGWEAAFDAVFCVGNSLTHARGRRDRREALAAMAGVLRDGGLLALTSRDWEGLRERAPTLEVGDRLVERAGRRGLVVHAWTIPAEWVQPHALEVAVALIDAAGGVTTRGERLEFWPFTHAELEADLRAAGLEPASSTYDGVAERYLVTALRAAGG